MVKGFGIYEQGEFAGTEGGKQTRGYCQWNAMIQRCYCAKVRARTPTYTGCSVAEEFRRFQDFMRWATVQAGYGAESAQLDKDLLVKGNRVYGPDLCLYIPRELNIVLTNSAAARGDLPIGVHVYQGAYRAGLSVGGKTKHLGTFATPEEAFIAYKNEKEANIKRLAEKYKEVLDQRAYVALQCYQVEATD